MATTNTKAEALENRTDSSPREYTIDAGSKTLGRAASEAAHLLSGKAEVDYAPHRVSNVRVTIENASKLDISERRREGTHHTHYTGYPGGLRYQKLGELIDKKGVEEALRRAIKGMLAKNKLQNKKLKNLTITQ